MSSTTENVSGAPRIKKRGNYTVKKAPPAVNDASPSPSYEADIKSTELCIRPNTSPAGSGSSTKPPTASPDERDLKIATQAKEIEALKERVEAAKKTENELAAAVEEMADLKLEVEHAQEMLEASEEEARYFERQVEGEKRRRRAAEAKLE